MRGQRTRFHLSSKARFVSCLDGRVVNAPTAYITAIEWVLSSHYIIIIILINTMWVAKFDEGEAAIRCIGRFGH